MQNAYKHLMLHTYTYAYTCTNVTPMSNVKETHMFYSHILYFAKEI